jgi:Fe-S-cluster-containing dehydrogenase component
MNKQEILVIDLDRCIGCRGACQVACKTEHQIALGPSRSKLYTMGPEGEYPHLNMYFIPVMCQECENPSCVKVCPTGARYKSDDDGVIRVDRTVCIGCEACVTACPYDANIMNRELRVSDKCDICAELREKGEEPVCVKNCAGAAIYHGDVNDPESIVNKKMAEAGPEHVYSLADDEGDKPLCRFILKRGKWINTLPQFYKEV